VPSYKTVCNAIGLPNLAHFNMDSEIAACERRLLEGGIDSAFQVSSASKCWVIQKEGGASTGRSGNEPGVVLGNVSVRPAPAPLNNPTLPMNPESGAGSAHAGPPKCDVGTDSRDVPPLERLAAAAAQVDGGTLTGKETAAANPEHETDQGAGTPSEESLGETIRDGMATITCSQLPTGGTSFPTEIPLPSIDSEVDSILFPQANGDTESGTWAISPAQWEEFIILPTSLSDHGSLEL
jgi:hypothetical protein